MNAKIDRENIRTIEELIIDILYENRELNFTYDGLKIEVEKKYKKLHNANLDISDFRNVLKKICNENFIGSRKAVFPIPRDVPPDVWTGEQEEIEIFYLREKGIARVLENELREKNIRLSNHEKMLTEIVGRVEEQARDVENTKKEFFYLKKYMDNKFNEVKKIRNEFEQVRKEFYTKILEIFGIFVAIFSFIIVGFAQVPSLVKAENDWLKNLSNASAIFLPLTFVLILLLICIEIINRSMIKK